MGPRNKPVSDNNPTGIEIDPFEFNEIDPPRHLNDIEKEILQAIKKQKVDEKQTKLIADQHKKARENHNLLNKRYLNLKERKKELILEHQANIQKYIENLTVLNESYNKLSTPNEQDIKKYEKKRKELNGTYKLSQDRLRVKVSKLNADINHHNNDISENKYTEKLTREYLESPDFRLSKKPKQKNISWDIDEETFSDKAPPSEVALSFNMEDTPSSHKSDEVPPLEVSSDDASGETLASSSQEDSEEDKSLGITKTILNEIEEKPYSDAALNEAIPANGFTTTSEIREKIDEEIESNITQERLVELLLVAENLLKKDVYNKNKAELTIKKLALKINSNAHTTQQINEMAETVKKLRNKYPKPLPPQLGNFFTSPSSAPYKEESGKVKHEKNTYKRKRT